MAKDGLPTNTLMFPRVREGSLIAQTMDITGMALTPEQEARIRLGEVRLCPEKLLDYSSQHLPELECFNGLRLWTHLPGPHYLHCYLHCITHGVIAWEDAIAAEELE